MSVARGVACSVGGLMLAACTALPKAELTAYTAAYADVQVVTNGILDIVAPYERVVIRYAAKNTTRIVVPSSPTPAPPNPPAPAPGVDCSLAANPAECASNRSAPQSVDCSLAANPVECAASRTARPPTPQRTTRTVVIERPCRTVGGADPYCYELRDGYADIGDPPLVAAYRNLSIVILRFNLLLAAYSDGISGRLLRQELDGLSSAVNDIVKLAPATSMTGYAGAFAASFTGVVNALLPIANLAGGIIDRNGLRTFLLSNYVAVDDALVLMSRNSALLYQNVGVGTQLFQIKTRGAGANLNMRRREIRRLIANWTVVLDDARRALRELRVAVEASDGLETRIRNLEATVTTRIDTSAIKKQIATLGTPVLPP